MSSYNAQRALASKVGLIDHCLLSSSPSTTSFEPQNSAAALGILGNVNGGEPAFTASTIATPAQSS
jgi:hypothetical protein